MDPNDRRNEQQSARERNDTSTGESLRDAPPGSSILNSTPGVRSPEDNAVQQLSRDAGDVLAEEVREGRWNTAEEERDDTRRD